MAAVQDALGHRDQRAALGQAQAFGGGTAIGADQTAGTELDAAIPAGHQHGDTVIALAIDGGQDRAPGCARRFAIVAGTVFVAMAVGPAIVRGIGHRDRVEERQRLIGAGDRRGMRNEAAVFDFQLMAGTCGKGIEHCPPF